MRGPPRRNLWYRGLVHRNVFTRNSQDFLFDEHLLCDESVMTELLDADDREVNCMACIAKGA